VINREGALLSVQSLVSGYGGVRILNGVDVDVMDHGVVALLGANGVGKTTLLRAISGLIPSMEGRIKFGGVRIDGLATHRITRLGISHVPEGRGIFPGMSVRENLQLASFASAQRGLPVESKEVMELFPILGQRLSQRGGSLSGGEQQMLAIARAMSARPRLLLLDEPSFGLAPRVVQHLYEALAVLKQRGIAMLLAEQAAREVLEIADFAYVIGSGGRILASGEPQELLAEMDLLEAYLQ
jgi:branched-chain amino acid transport system ATP-binding protein